MSFRKHVHEELFPISAEELFRHLYTPTSICKWWSAEHAIVLAQPGGTYAATWGASHDDPDYTTVATISEFEPGRRMVFTDYRYSAKQGALPFKADFVTEFLVESHPEGATLRVTQDGFPAGSEADEFYAGCETGWRDTFAGIRRFIEELSSSD